MKVKDKPRKRDELSRVVAGTELKTDSGLLLALKLQALGIYWLNLCYIHPRLRSTGSDLHWLQISSGFITAIFTWHHRISIIFTIFFMSWKFLRTSIIFARFGTCVRMRLT